MIGVDLQLIWDDVISVNDSYQLQWRPYGSDAWETLGEAGESATSYTHAGAATAGNEYRIRAVNEFGPAGADEGWVEYPVVSISPTPGEYSTGFDLVMESSTDASIYYTTNGDAPDATATHHTAPATYDVVLTADRPFVAGPSELTTRPLGQARAGGRSWESSMGAKWWMFGISAMAILLHGTGCRSRHRHCPRLRQGRLRDHAPAVVRPAELLSS